MPVVVSLDVGVCDFDFGIALQYEEEAEILIGQVEYGIVVLADRTQVVLLNKEVDNRVDG